MLQLNRFQFKLLLAFLMVLDHIDFFVSDNLNILFKILSRCVAVGFAYLVVDGFLYTKNLKKYLLRLYGFAIFMLIGNHFFNALYAPYHIVIKNSIIMTYAIGLTMLFILSKVKKNFFIRFICCFALFYISDFFEGGFIILLFMYFSYIYHDDEKKRNIAYLIFSAVLFALTLNFALQSKNPIIFILKRCEFLFISIIPLLKIYNRKQGLNNAFSKYFFYIFYPVHLWIINYINYIMVK